MCDKRKKGESKIDKREHAGRKENSRDCFFRSLTAGCEHCFLE